MLFRKIELEVFLTRGGGTGSVEWVVQVGTGIAQHTIESTLALEAFCRLLWQSLHLAFASWSRVVFLVLLV